MADEISGPCPTRLRALALLAGIAPTLAAGSAGSQPAPVGSEV